MPKQDFYETLGVSKSATADEIRKAHKKLSRKYHPDVNQGNSEAEQKFKEVQTAFEILGDEEKRKQYDQFGSAAFEQGGMPGGFPAGGFRWTGAGGGGPVDLESMFGGQVDLGDLLGGAFGGGGRSRNGRRPRKGQDAELTIDVPFHVACEGGQHEISLQRNGKVERVAVKIPAGVDTGSVIRLAGQGEPGISNGPPGDLLLTIRVAPHPWFRREGAHLSVDVPVTFVEAALGGKVDVPTLTEGRILVTVPAGTSSGAKLRLRGKGIVDRQSGQRGDLFAVVKIVSPSPLSPETRRLLEELGKAGLGDPRAKLWT